MRLTLTAARKRRRLTPEQLSERCDGKVSRATIYRLEADAEANPNHATVTALETALGLRPGSLLFGRAA